MSSMTFISSLKDRRIVCLFAYDNRSYSLFEKSLLRAISLIIKDDGGNEVVYRIDWKDVVFQLDNSVIKSLK